MKKTILSFFPALLLLISQTAYCSSTIVAHVTAIGTYGNGNLYVSLDQTIDQSGCSVAIIQIPAANAAAIKLVSVAGALAFSLGSTVSIHTDVCYNGAASFSGSSEAFFIVNKQ